MIERLEDHPSVQEPEPFAGPDHPMRRLTRSVALGEPWTQDDADRVAAVFDELAEEWSARHIDDTKAAPVRDALERGDVPTPGAWLELGSGTGAGSRILSGIVGSLIARDLSAEMLQHGSTPWAIRHRSISRPTTCSPRCPVAGPGEPHRRARASG